MVARVAPTTHWLKPVLTLSYSRTGGGSTSSLVADGAAAISHRLATTLRGALHRTERITERLMQFCLLDNLVDRVDDERSGNTFVL